MSLDDNNKFSFSKLPNHLPKLYHFAFPPAMCIPVIPHSCRMWCCQCFRFCALIVMQGLSVLICNSDIGCSLFLTYVFFNSFSELSVAFLIFCLTNFINSFYFFNFYKFYLFFHLASLFLHLIVSFTFSVAGNAYILYFQIVCYLKNLNSLSYGSCVCHIFLKFNTGKNHIDWEWRSWAIPPELNEVGLNIPQERHMCYKNRKGSRYILDWGNKPL